MNGRLTLVTAGRVLRQVRHDRRTLALLIVVPCVLMGLLAWIYADTPVFDAIGAPLLGMAHKLLPVIGVEVSAAAVARFYGARARGALLDAWVVDNADAAAVPGLVADGIATGATDLLMRTPEATADIIRFGLGLLA